jgi:hypothetical protein
MSEPFDAAEERAAVALDEEIDAVFAGEIRPGEDPTVLALATALSADPGPSLARRVAADRARVARRRLGPLRVVAGFMAYLFLWNGIGNLVAPDWIARNVGEPNATHFATEGGLALVAVGLVVGAAALRPVWLPVAVTAGLPLGLAFGVIGAGEVGQFTGGAVLHLTQLGVAIALAVGFWRLRRYVRVLHNEQWT